MTQYTTPTTKRDREFVACHRQSAQGFKYGIRKLDECYVRPSNAKRTAYDKCLATTLQILEESELHIPMRGSYWGVTSFNSHTFVFTYTDDNITIVITPTRVLVEEHAQ